MDKNKSFLQKIYDLKTWNQEEDNIKLFIVDQLKNSLSTNDIKEIESIEEKFLEDEHNFKKGFSWNKYHFFIFLMWASALVLFIPFYWIHKSWKKMRDTKDQLNEIFKKSLEDKMQIHQEKLSNINVYKIFDDAISKIGYKQMGPIPNGFIKKLNEYTVFDSDFLPETKYTNNYVTSWATFMDRNIILNLSNISHSMKDKTYSESRSYTYYVSDGKGNRVSRSETLTAYYTHPHAEYNKSQYCAVFTKYCEGLEFYLEEYKPKRFLKVKEKEGDVALDNKVFNNAYRYERNDENKFRIFFTVDVQEYLTQQIDKSKTSYLYDYLSYWKRKSLIGTKQQMPTLIYNNKKFGVDNFNSEKFLFKTYIKSCTENMIEIIKTKYLQLNPMTVSGLIVNENNKKLINEITDLYLDTKIGEEDMITAQSIFSSIYQKKVIPSDTTVMNVFKVINKTKVKDTILVLASIDANSYFKHQKYMPVTVYGVNTGSHVINVPYYHFEPTNGKSFMYYARINNNNFYNEIGSDLPDEIINLIKSVNLEIYIRSGYFICISQNKIDEKIFIPIINKLQEHENKNKEN